jgi:serine/threonine protein kinase
MSKNKIPQVILPPGLEKRYKIIRELGQGAYGVVWYVSALVANARSSAKDLVTDQEVAIKRVSKVFDKNILAKRCLRELKLLKHFNGHENVRPSVSVSRCPHAPCLETKC